MISSFCPPSAHPLRLASERFDVDRIEDLSIREASALIDELKRNAPAMWA